VEGLATPAAPAGLLYLLHSFHELGSARQAGFGSPCAIGWSEMQAWSRLTGTPLAAWEVRVLRLLDAAWISAWGQGQKKNN